MQDRGSGLMEIKTVIVGTKHLGIDALATLARLEKGSAVTLEREPANRYDPSAVAVYSGEQQIGYLPKNGYAEVVRAMDARIEVSAEITLPAIVQGREVVRGGLPKVTVKWSE